MAAGEPEGVRWVVLFCMFCLGLAQATGWMTYSANPDISSQYYGFTDPQASIDMLLNWGPLMYLPVAPVVGWVVAKYADSLWGVVLSGAVLTSAGLVLRLVPSLLAMDPTCWAAHALIHTGQALNGMAGPMNCVTPSALAALWFPSHQRAFATSVVYGIQMAGPSVGFLLAFSVRNSQQLIFLMEMEALFSLLVLAAWGCLPRKPKHPPSLSQELRSRGSSGAAEPVPLRRWVSASVLVMAGSLAVGVFQCWSPALPTQLEGVLPNGLLKWFSVITSVASLVGNFAAPFLIEALHLQLKLKLALVAALLVQVFAFTMFACAMPDSPVPLGTTSSPAPLLAWLVLASVAEGAMAPVVYELAAELLYPYSEGVTGAVFSWLLNLWGFVLLWIFPLLPSSYDSLMMAGTCVVALLSLVLLRAEYPRRLLDEGACQRAELLSPY